jgi:hypothetical protein
MCYLISLALQQGLAKKMESRLGIERVHLFAVVVVNKRLNGFNRCKDSPGTKQCRKSPGEEPSESPYRDQSTVVGAW